MASANSTIDETSNIHYKYICDELKQNSDEAVLYLQFKPSYYSERYPNRRKLESAYHSLTTEQQNKLKTFFEKAAQSSQTVRQAETKAKKNYAFQRHSQKPASSANFTCPNRDYESHGTQYNQTHALLFNEIQCCGTIRVLNQVIINMRSECEKNRMTCRTDVYHSILHKCVSLASKSTIQDFSVTLEELIRLNPLRGKKAISACCLFFKICVNTFNCDYARKLLLGNKNTPSLLMQWRVTLNEQAYSVAIKSCAETKNTQLFNILFQAISNAIENGDFHPTQILCIELIQYYCAVNDAQSVRELLFDRKGKSSLMRKWKIQGAVKIYSAAVTFCANTSDELLFQEIYHAVLEKITDKTIVLDVRFGGVLAKYYLKIKDTDAFRTLILGNEETKSLMQRWQLPIDIIFFNIGFSLCADSQDNMLFDSLCSMMISEINMGNIKANSITCITILSYCEAVKNDIAARELVLGRGGEKSLMSRWGVKPCENIYGAAFNVCAATFNHQLFKCIYQQMLDNKIRPNAIAVISLLNYYLTIKDDKATEELIVGSDDANSLISQWGQQDYMPIYSAAIQVCTATFNRRLFEEIYQIIRRKIDQRQIAANSILCLNLLVCLAALKNAAAAFELLSGTDAEQSLMDKWGVRPDNKIRGAAINVCAQTQNRLLFNKLYREILSGISDKKMTPNAHFCGQLISYFASVGDYPAAYQVLFSDETYDFTRLNDSELIRSPEDITHTIKESSASAPLSEMSSASTVKNLLKSASEDSSEAPLETCAINSTVSLIARWDVTPDIVLLDKAIIAYTKLKRPDWVIQALKFFILTWNIKPEQTSFRYLLEHFSQEGNTSAAEILFFGKITQVTDNSEVIRVLPADIRNPFTSADRSDRDYNREWSELIRLSDKANAPVSGRGMSDSKTKKPTYRYTIAWGIPCDEMTCRAFLSFCFKNKQIELAKKMMDMCAQYKITITPAMHALFVMQEPGNFKAQLQRGIENNIYRAHLGLTDGSLDLHISAVFQDSKNSEEATLGLPFEFAKQLWFYHLEKGKTITSLITGYHGKTKLREQILEFADGKGVQVIIDPENPGKLTIPKRVLWGSHHMKLTSDVLTSGT